MSPERIDAAIATYESAGRMHAADMSAWADAVRDMANANVAVLRGELLRYTTDGSLNAWAMVGLDLEVHRTAAARHAARLAVDASFRAWTDAEADVRIAFAALTVPTVPT